MFISYSRRDEAAVRSLMHGLSLRHGLRREPVGVLLVAVHGVGDAWWTAILQKIRDCTVFIYALSNNSLPSKPCGAEIGYASALGLPILAVQIRRVDVDRIDPILTLQSVDYRNFDATTGLALMAELHERAAKRKDLPEPLPELCK